MTVIRKCDYIAMAQSQADKVSGSWNVLIYVDPEDTRVEEDEDGARVLAWVRVEDWEFENACDGED